MALRDLLRRRARTWRLLGERLTGRAAVEVGGPSRLFTRKGRLPVYTVLGRLDLVDHAEETLWRRAADADRAGRPPGLPPGRRIVAEAASLEGLPDGAYDAWLASHVLEHVADPLGALESARRVLRPPGWVLLVLPHRAGTFDHRRPVTPLEHLEADRGVGEDDTTHVAEVLALHDLARDPDAGDRAAFERRVAENARHRALHHHVFDPPLAVRMLDARGFGVEAVEVLRPYHIVLLARADGQGREANARHLEAEASWRRGSPFAAERAS